MNKRIEILKRFGKVSVVHLKRKKQDIWSPVHNDIEHYAYEMDLPQSRQILRRMAVSSVAQRWLYGKLEQLRPDLVYTEGLDTLMAAVKYKRRHPVKILYEAADLREIFISTPRSRVKRLVKAVVERTEAACFSKVDGLVVTSPKFYDVHFSRLISRDKTCFLPNTPDLSAFRDYRKKRGGAFTIGFIGGIRYLQQMQMLADAVKDTDMHARFAGAGDARNDRERIMDYCRENANVSFSGKYAYDREIAGLYGMVDCVYSVYDADNPNVRIALPNKLYEAVYCELPIIVARGTYLAELVEEWGVGVAVDHRDGHELKAVLHRLSTDQEYYNGFVRHCRLHKAEIDLEKYNRRLSEMVLKLAGSCGSGA